MRFQILLFLVLGLAAALSTQPKTSLRCEACHGFFDVLRYSIDSSLFIDSTEDLLVGLCEIFEPSLVCLGMKRLYSEAFVNELSQKFLDPSYMCAHIGACDFPIYHYQNMTTFTENVLKDVPPVAPWPTPSGASYYIAQVTDMHVDFNYVPGSNPNCDLPLCCRDGQGPAGPLGYFGKCDVPPQTVDVLLDFLSEINPKFVMWTGDNPPHDIWAYEREREMNITRKLVNMFKAKLTMPVYPIIGNHDCYPMDLFNPDHEEVLLGELSSLWTGWLPESSIAEFSKNGYYSAKDPITGVRIIGINNQLGDNFNVYLLANNTDPGNMLAWLRNTLYEAERNEEPVIILGHIPHGDHFADSGWALHYRVIANRFQNTIKGQFFGHTHNDEFNIVKSLLPGQSAAGVLHVAPSLTTYSYHNPSFRLYEFDSVSHNMLNIHQYRLPLHKNTLQFEKVYDYKELYGMEDMSPSSFQDLVRQVKDDEKTGQTFWENFNGQYDFQATECDEQCRTTLYCSMHTDVFDENYTCDSHHTSEERFYHFLEKLLGNRWEYK